MPRSATPSVPSIRPVARGGALALLCILATGLTCASAPERALTPVEVGLLRDVNEVVISPDGSLTAYTLSVPRDPRHEDNGSAWTELWVVDGAGVQRPFVTGEVRIAHIGFSPDGRQISFLSKRGDDEHDALWSIPVDGGEARRILTHATAITDYSFAPDGEHVAFLAVLKEDESVEAMRKKGFDAKVVEEQWRPVRVWIGTPDAEAREYDSRMLGLAGSASRVRWSPTGDALAVATAPTPSIDDAYMERDVDVVDPTSGAVLHHLELPGKLGPFAWAPDGKALAVVAGADENDPKEGRLLYWPLDTGEWREVLPEYLGHVRDLDWADANTIAFIGDEGAWSTFNRLNVASGERTAVVPTGGPILESATLSRDGKAVAFAAHSPQHPREVYGLATGTLERLTVSNPWLADIPLAPQEVVRFKARDGMEIEGILIRPRGQREGQRYPLIVTVHGGPESHIPNGWVTRYSYPGQLAAARGFAVFLPNYRGSTGRGVAFSKLGQSDYAGAEFNDLVDAIEHLVGMGLVDEKRVGITGGSYGGFASAWAATKLTEHFAASVMFVGISEHISKAGTTDIPNEMFKVHSRRWPWEHWDWFRERSPLFYVEQARTPLLILHGEEDTRVHPSQSMQLFRYLKLIDKTPVRLVLYPGEGHGNRKAASRLDYNLRMMRWFEHYLKGPGGSPPAHDISGSLTALGFEQK